MAIKVIMMDVDGTLTNSQKIITPKTKEALLKAQEKGVVLILASGRPTSGLRELEKELEMIDVNIKAMHILLKTFTQHWKTQKQEAYVLNVASLAAFQAGPKMATYYATKAYVLHLSEAVAFELKKEELPIHISTLCPGPVATEFNQVANVKFHVKELSPQKVAKLGVKGMFKNKAIIIPGLKGKLGIFFSRFISRKMAQRVVYRVQEKKINGK